MTAAYRGDELLGWAFSSSETVGSVGYSGRALDILVGLDAHGRIAGARLLAEEEPIFAAARTRAELERFLDELPRPAGRRLLIEVRRGGGEGAVAAVSGATISSLVINDAILRAARAVARAKGLLGQPGGIDRESFEPVDWAALVADGSIVTRRVSLGDVTALLARQGLRPDAAGDPTSLFVELFVGLASPARIGRNLIGLAAFRPAHGRPRPGRPPPVRRRSRPLLVQGHRLGRGAAASTASALARPTAPSASAARTMSGSTSWRWRARPSCARRPCSSSAPARASGRPSRSGCSS